MDLSSIPLAQRPMANEIIKKCITDRTWFIENVLNVREIQPWQREVLEALDGGENKISIRSGHGVGKTALCSWLGLHFLLFRDDVKVIITSPSLKQMTDGLMPEMSKWISKLPEWMSSQCEITSDRVVRKPNTKNNFVSFRTARKENPEALAGVHAENVLIIVDEASGVDEVIYETGQGALSTHGAIAVLIGNPTKPSGFFYKTQTSLSDLWWTRKVSCLDSVRVDPEYVSSQLRTYGEESREYRVRVLGEFPDSDADAIIPREFVESAIGREIASAKGDTCVWGLDPGRSSDPSGFVSRNEHAVLELVELRYDNTMRVVGWVKSKWDDTPPDQRPSSIFVDVIGLGAGVSDRLSEMGLPVVAVNVAEAAALRDRFARLRPELWYAGRAWFEQRDVTIPFASELPLVPQLVEELCSVQQKYTSTGRVDAETKSDMKSRGIASPNLADAFLLTFALGGAIANGNYDDGVSWGKFSVDDYVPANVY